MKNIYLVRHGETDSNLKPTWRTANESLTENGILQAQQVGKRLATLPIERMVVSTASRTMSTAKEISVETGLEVNEDSLFYEEKTPTSIQGMLHEKKPDNEVEQYIQALLAHSEEVDWHYEDEENLVERKNRIAKIHDYLLAAPENHLLVVTHGNIMKMLAAYITLGPSCTAKDLYLSSQKLKTTNTGITKLIVEEGEFRILQWNDHAHFAE